MKFMKNGIVFSLFAIAGLTLANLNAGAAQTSEGRYGYGYYGHPLSQVDHPASEQGKRMSVHGQEMRAKKGKKSQGWGWGVNPQGPHSNPTDPQHPRGLEEQKSASAPLMQAPADMPFKKSQGWGWGVTGRSPHSNPEHPQYQRWLQEQQVTETSATSANLPSEHAQGWGAAGKHPHEQPGHPQHARWLEEQAQRINQAPADLPPSYEQTMTMPLSVAPSAPLESPTK